MAVERVYWVRCDNPACGRTSTPEATKEQAQITARHEGINWHYVPQTKGPPKRKYQCAACKAAVYERNAARMRETT